jgi:replicative DNA helicase
MLGNQILTLLSKKESEIQVLGSIFLKNELMENLFLEEDHFFDTKHKKILWLMKEMKKKGYEIDPVSLITMAAEYNLVEDIGGISYISGEIQVATASNFNLHQDTVLNLYKKREAVKVANMIIDKVVNEKIDDVASEASNKLSTVLTLGQKESSFKHISEVMSDVYSQLLENGGSQGWKTHFNDLDSILGGLKSQDFVIIGARPSMGKTAFAMAIAESHASKNKGVVGVFSAEMPNIGIGSRMLSSQSLVESIKFREPDQRLTKDDWVKLTHAIGSISENSIYITDESSLTIPYIRKNVKMLADKHPGEKLVIIIDYLQLIQGEKHHKGNRTQEISEISRELKRIARETGANMIALSQLSRTVEQRQDKRPMMSDLRESGQIEQDADVIAFLYRDDYYDKESEYKNITEVIIAKNRQGPIGTASIGFKKEFSKFVNIQWN